MSAVYSSFRDVSGILTPGVAWLVLLVAPCRGSSSPPGWGMWRHWAVAGAAASAPGHAAPVARRALPGE